MFAMKLLLVLSVLSIVNAWGTGKWKASCNPANVTSDCHQDFQNCGPWTGTTDSWTDNRCYCIPYQNANCCHGALACQKQNKTCSGTLSITLASLSITLALNPKYQCDRVNHQCRADACLTLGQAAGLSGAAATVVGFNQDGNAVDATGTKVKVTTTERKALQNELDLESQEAQQDPRWTATDGTIGSTLKDPNTQGAQVQEQALSNGSDEVVLPVSSSVALIFLAFFVGIILAYGIYKVRKITKKDVVPGLDDSARLGQSQAQLNVSPRSSTEV
jgi:hypothetical protein